VEHMAFGCQYANIQTSNRGELDYIQVDQMLAVFLGLLTGFVLALLFILIFLVDKDSVRKWSSEASAMDELTGRVSPFFRDGTHNPTVSAGFSIDRKTGKLIMNGRRNDRVVVNSIK